MSRGVPLPPPAGRGEAPAGHVLLGEFGRAHGLKGEIRLKSYTADPLAIGRYGPLVDDRGRSFVVSDLRQAAGDQPDLLIARVMGVASREAAEALNRVRLYAARERLGEATEEDEFFLADLVGLRAEDVGGSPVGTVVAVPNYGGGDLLEIAPARGATLLIPFTKEFVPSVDIGRGLIQVVLPAEPDGEDGQDEEPAR